MKPSAWVDCYETATLETIRLTSANLATPLGSCPGWTARDLLAHVGVTPLTWSALMAHRGSSPPHIGSVVADAASRVPADPKALAEWVTTQVKLFVTTLRSIDPNEPMYTGGPSSEGWPSGTAAFWMRRGAVEESIHAWDAQSITGVQRPVLPSVASDGLDELTGGMITYWIAASPVSPARSLTLAPSDVDRRWVLNGTDTSTEVALVSGLAGSILLSLWGRDVAPVHGDVDVLREWGKLAAAV